MADNKSSTSPDDSPNVEKQDAEIKIRGDPEKISYVKTKKILFFSFWIVILLLALCAVGVIVFKVSSSTSNSPNVNANKISNFSANFFEGVRICWIHEDGIGGISIVFCIDGKCTRF